MMVNVPVFPPIFLIRTSASNVSPWLSAEEEGVTRIISASQPWGDGCPSSQRSRGLDGDGLGVGLGTTVDGGDDGGVGVDFVVGFDGGAEVGGGVGVGVGVGV